MRRSHRGPPGPNGFTLTELIITTLIAGGMMLGVGYVLLTAMNSQLKSTRQGLVQTGATIASKYLSRDIYQSSFLKSPGVGSFGLALGGIVGPIYTGSPGGVATWIDPPSGSPSYAFCYCVDATGQLLRLENDTITKSNAQAYACPACATSNGYTILIGSPLKVTGNLTGAAAFSRPTGLSNLAVAGFTITQPPPAQGGNPSSINVNMELASGAATVPPP